MQKEVRLYNSLFSWFIQKRRYVLFSLQSAGETKELTQSRPRLASELINDRKPDP